MVTFQHFSQARTVHAFEKTYSSKLNVFTTTRFLGAVFPKIYGVKGAPMSAIFGSAANGCHKLNGDITILSTGFYFHHNSESSSEISNFLRNGFRSRLYCLTDLTYDENFFIIRMSDDSSKTLTNELGSNRKFVADFWHLNAIHLEKC
jgi:hypothetical protein